MSGCPFCAPDELCALQGRDAMTAPTLDMDGRYTVAGYRGIAFYLLGYASEWTAEEWVYVGGDPEDEDSYAYSEGEEIENRGMVRAVMVGDDRVFEVDVDDLTPLAEDEYCSGCGQVGCGWC